MPHNVSTFLFFVGASFAIRADCPEFDNEPQIELKNQILAPMFYSKQKMLRKKAE